MLVRPESIALSVDPGLTQGNGQHARVQAIHFLGSLTRVDTLITDDALVNRNAGKPLEVTVQLPANEVPAGLAHGSDVVIIPRAVAALAV